MLILPRNVDREGNRSRDGREGKAGAQAAALSTALIAKSSPALAALAPVGGALVGQVVGQVQQELAKTGETIAELLSSLGASPRHASCGTAVLIVPEGHHIVGIIAYAKDVNAPWTKNSDLSRCTTQPRFQPFATISSMARMMGRSFHHADDD
jgi:hypothetical protein